MNWVREIDLKVAGYLNIAVIIMTIIVHLLVVFQVMPFTWINGGRSATFAIGRQTSIISIGILIVIILVNMWACKLIRVKKCIIIMKALLWFLFVYSIFGLVQQLLGTTFEKFIMSIVCTVNVIMYFRLAIENRQQTK